MQPPRNPPLAEIARRPMLRPHVVADPDPVLVYTDHQGRLQAVVLTLIDLAHLALSIAEVQAVAAPARVADSSSELGIKADLAASRIGAGGYDT
ncbi:hypothetical protein [Methylobacterium oryzihabitans]|uniref:Uncharacterized protein n=1 Tax=Methylobacterium oryzihabitans TaxID=2499852 RepID=A0A437NZL4_9HYPH|nr:hypothetical protein [Methylobacterium oryzihabitans]RVU15450.1 hypothetical protein EOE48_19465 [Methylobacterium oryzihabitans]